MMKNINAFPRCNGIYCKRIIETDLYVQPTDSHQYLLSSPCHPVKSKYLTARR